MQGVSVLFSEPKIPQFASAFAALDRAMLVSVLFSEPKIPQFPIARKKRWLEQCFSALQRAENSSILTCRYGL